MTLTVLAPPAVEPVSLDEAKLHLRVTYADEDALIVRLLTAARQRVEAALGLALIATGLRETLDGWPLAPDGSLELARGPLLGVSAIALAQASGPPTLLDPALYAPDVGSRPGRVRPAVWRGLGWPAPGVAYGGLSLDYTAGFGPAPGDTPEPLRQAILLLAGWAFENRDAGEPALGLVEPWLAPWRRVRL